MTWPFAVDFRSSPTTRPIRGRSAIPFGSDTDQRLILFTISSVLLVVAGFVFVAVYLGAASRGEVGYDAGFYAALGHRFLESGTYYSPSQFDGPYRGEGFVNLYPPLAMYLFAPFSVLPAPLWWAVPIGVLVWHVWKCRPAQWSWPVIAALVATIPVSAALIYGNTTLWSAAFVALGFRWPAIAAVLVFKPTDLIAAAFFARKRRFWVGLIVMAAVALPFGTAWFDYLTVLGNVDDGSLLRNLPGLAVLAIPVVAWSARYQADHSGRAARLGSVGPRRPATRLASDA